MDWEQGYNAAGVAHLVRTALEKDDLSTAIDLCRELNQRASGYGPGWHLAAQIALKLDNPASALAMAQRAVGCQPDPVVEMLIVACHSRLGHYREGRAAARILGHAQPPHLALQRAQLLLELGCPDDAAAQYRYLIDTQGANPTLLAALADALRLAGRIEEASATLDQAIQLAPHQDDLWATRAFLQRQSESHHHIDTLQFAIARRTSPCPALHYALAKEWADLRCEEAAWQNLHTGAQQQQQALGYQVDRDRAQFQAIQALFPAPGSGQPRASERPRPLFLAGLPDGSIEAIADYLSQHDQVVHLGPINRFLPELERQLAQQARLNGKPLWGSKAKLMASTQLDLEPLAQAYRSSLPPESEGARWVIDTSPGHDQHLGLLLQALPEARAILPQRPLASSGAALYQQWFGPEQPYSYDPTQLGHYLLAHRQLMAHWQTRHPEQLLVLDMAQSASDASRMVWDHLALTPLPPPANWPMTTHWGDPDKALPELIAALVSES
ncbi:sulfotransferase [Ferrimonas balearica]|uniref:sulfotransferase n=1 Tax=Ferrimonas balearica TaxID=44012 RepID=UPI001C99304F|nr:sulfotransferase [Ferrimonas balearica]MBY5923121.1 sulfotransferase [Ferrimonas balearica]MBY5997503.1 sulfotransferase [Ferrimonas balearica]